MCRSRQTRTAAAEAGSRGRLYQTPPTGPGIQDSDLLAVGSRVDSIKNFQQCSFSGVSLPAGRLVLAEVR